jgi:hypothetical protein
MLYVSSSHVQMSDGIPDFGNFRNVEHVSGWIVFVASLADQRACPNWLRPIMEAAFEQNCILINFDTSAPRWNGN